MYKKITYWLYNNKNSNLFQPKSQGLYKFWNMSHNCSSCVEIITTTNGENPAEALICEVWSSGKGILFGFLFRLIFLGMMEC